jgi:pyrimidine-nucleoside phosphorylase
MQTIRTIQAKRNGEALSPDAIREVLAGYTAGEVPDYQMAALLMAIYLQGMSPPELEVWADAMLHSGEVLDWSSLGIPTADKHSTGGVGDKISLPLAPAVAACGVAVPMISGRALGHTGGTLDKLEAIPGFTVGVSNERAREIVAQHGVVLMGQTAQIAPADKKIYALRDATGTVESIPLIASSIMSKKLAEGVDALVLDVKVGSGAFMKTEARARELAETLVGIGEAAGCRTVALLTRMDRPLGRLVGNALEVAESIATLRGEGPADIRELVCLLGGEMLALTGVATSAEEGRTRIGTALDDGSALARFRGLVEAQGGDVACVDDPGQLPSASGRHVVRARTSGVVTAIDAEDVGRASMRLGAGRAVAEDPIDPAVGLEVLKTVGDVVTQGDPLVELHFNDGSRLESAEVLIHEAYTLGQTPANALELCIGRVGMECS